MKGRMLEAKQRLILRPPDNSALEEQAVSSPTSGVGAANPRPSFLGPGGGARGGAGKWRIPTPTSPDGLRVTGAGGRKPSGPYPQANHADA